MRTIDAAFGSVVLAAAHKLVKQHFPHLNLRKAAWVYKTDRQSWEFHGPEEFWWYGHADSAADARANGWFAYLRHKGIEE